MIRVKPSAMILERMTLKGFGRDRAPGGGLSDTSNVGYSAIKAGGLSSRWYLAERREHGHFSRSSQPDSPAKPNFAFTSDRYWQAEKKPMAQARRQISGKMR